MTEKREQLIGARFTKREKEIIENFVKSQNTNITDFVREAIFSHMNNLKENVGIINLDTLIEELGKIEDTTKITMNSLDTLKNLFQQYGLTKMNYGKNKSSPYVKL